MQCAVDILGDLFFPEGNRVVVVLREKRRWEEGLGGVEKENCPWDVLNEKE